MATIDGMETYAARLASFDVAHPSTKRRASNAKGAKTLKWPHKTPTPAHLARAGFFYRPTTSCPDNATCFLCQKGLDGWEEDDDPAAEHRKHSPECGWAITVCIEQEIEDGRCDGENPLGDKILNARKSTFGTMWPHDSKRGWSCKTQKMVEAGWYYCPTPESDDFVKCPYCSLGLDGWEPKDNPYDEHQRRSQDCVFFSLSASTHSKPARTKKDRTSKASRMSTQSNFTSISEAPSLAEIEVEEGDSVLTTATDTTTTSTMPKISKKGGRSKKPTAKGTKRVTTQIFEPEHTSSFIEPEDDDFEVKVAALPSKGTRGKKRNSGEMDVDTPTQIQGAIPDAALTQPRPAKRRATRSRSTMSQKHLTTDEAPHAAQDADVSMTDAESMPPPQVMASKKRGKGVGKRATSAARVVSTASTASMASLRATIPADDEIDAVLEAELDRPLTDDEQDVVDIQEEKPKKRRLTRTRPGSRKATASTAPVRETRASTLAVVDTEEQTTESMTLNIPYGLASAKDMHSESEAQPNEEDLVVSKVKTAKGKTVRKASASQRKTTKKNKVDGPRGADQSQDQSQNVSEAKETAREVEVSLAQDLPTHQPPARLSRSRQTLRSPPVIRSQASEHSNSDHVTEAVVDVDSSTITPRTVEDDSGHETDTSATSHAPPKKAGGKAARSVKKGKGGKRSATLSRTIEGDDQQPRPTSNTQNSNEKETYMEHEDAELLPNAPVEEAAEVPSIEPSEPVMDARPAKELKTNKKAAKSTKKKAGKANPKAVAADALTQAGEETNDTIPQDTQPAKDSSPPLIEISNPTPPGTHEPTATIAVPAPHPTSPTPPSPPQATPSPSPQSSDAENHPPSAPHYLTRPPLAPLSPPNQQDHRIPLAASTPTSNRTHQSSRLQSAFPWTAVDLENVFIANDSPGKENLGLRDVGTHALTSPEKNMSVEEWILWNAGRGEERLRTECERLVGRFEGEGVRALRALEGIVVQEG